MWVAALSNTQLNTALIQGNEASLKGDEVISTFIRLLYSKLTYKGYKDAVQALASELAIDLTVVTPEPPAVVEPAPEPAPQPTPAPQPAPEPVPVPTVPADFAAQVLAVLKANGLYLEDGMVGVGGIDPSSAATLQVFGNKYVPDASIQLTTRGMVTTESLSGDGGFRTLNNQRVTKASHQAYDPNGKVWYTSHMDIPNPNGFQSQIGVDSRHQFSIVRRDPNHEHEYTQDVVLVIDEDNKQVSWQSWRTGFNWALVTDGKFGPARIWRAITSLWT